MMMKILGFSEGYHDAGVTLIENGEILYASHAERYSKKKNDRLIHPHQIKESDVVVFYEKSFLKNIRRLYSGQGWKRRKTTIPYDYAYSHHQSHAAAGYFTSPFDDCNILVIDAIGEWDTISIWDGIQKVISWKYPYSLGLLYSAVTHRIGLKPNEDEYITMGMAAYGEPIYDLSELLSRNNHKGLGNYKPNAREEDLAASVQFLYEKELLSLVELCPKDNLILMGGCALNCVANSKIKNKNIWIMPNPGDAGSSLGAASLYYGEKLNWVDPYLGYELPRSNPKKIVKELLKSGVCGVASERAEFGPRALGNRSLLADCRLDIKDKVNEIKRRQKYRPFAPAILEEYADEYFDGPMDEYMQFVSYAKHDYDSVTHVDGTSRVQLVKPNCKSVIREILEEWYNKTGVPMLLNTSLNIKGMPMVNDEMDVKNFMKRYEVNVL
jgi:carbamoyltransferase